MEVIRGLLSRSFTCGLNFMALTFFGWVCLLVPIGATGRATFGWQLFFVAGASALAWLMLRPASFPDSLRTLPRKSDLLMVGLAIPAAGIAQWYLMRGVFGIEIASLQCIAAWSPFMALSVFLYYYLLSSSSSDFGMARRIVLDLHPTERAALLGDFAACDLDQHVRFLSRADLGEHLLKGCAHELDLIISSKPVSGQFQEDSVLIRAHLAGIPILDYREVAAKLSGRIRLSHLDVWSFIVGTSSYTPLLKAFIALKALIEPVLAVVLAVILAPLMAGVALAIKLTSKGPVFYTQIRTGYRGKTFTLVKFRSMYTDAESNGPQWASSNDPRVTPVGAFLRKTRLDEIPQLWNVMRGEMGFIGPRPERPEIYKSLKNEIPLFSLRTMIRPGITGWAQVCAGYAASVAESETKLEYDLFYIQNVSPRLDLIILVKTLQVAVLGDRSARRTEEVVVPMAAKLS